MVYNEIKALLPKITDVNLHQKMSRAKKIYTLFTGIGIDKIQVVSSSASAISSLTETQVQDIVIFFSKSSTDTDECQKVIGMTNRHAHVTESSIVSISIAPIPLTHVSNSSGPVNSSVIPYEARAPYINVALKEYPYLSLFNSDRHNDGYEFRSSGLCPGCEKEHDKGKVLG